MKQQKSKIVIIILILFIVGVSVYFAITQNINKEEEKQEVTYQTINMITSFRLGISEYDTINPYITLNREILYIDTLLYEPLLNITKDYNIEGCLAKEWSKVDQKSYVIKLKENIKWSSGASFTAKNVKDAIEMVQNNKNSVYYENVKDIKKVEVIDSSTIRLELNKEIPFFEYNLIFPIILPNSNTPIGTGKYKISKLQKDKIELTINEQSNESQKPNIKNITINLYETMGEVYNAFKLGNIDFLHTTNQNAQEYIGSMGYGKSEYMGREYDYLALNCNDTILKYPEVRRAISLAIDQEKIVANTLKNKAYSTYLPLEENHYLVKESQLTKTTNLEEAKKILEENGWKYEYGIWKKEIDGITKSINITLSVSKSNNQRVEVAKEIKKQLETLGIKVSIEEISDAKYQSYLTNKNYEILFTGIYTSLSPDISSFFEKGNIANYENEEISNILEDLNNITDISLQKEKYKQMLNIYLKEAPYISLYRNQNLIAYNNDFRGDVTPNNYNIYYNFEQWYREQ